MIFVRQKLYKIIIFKNISSILFLTEIKFMCTTKLLSIKKTYISTKYVNRGNKKIFFIESSY